MQNLKDICDHIVELLPAALLAAFGGFTRAVAGKPKGEKFDWKIALPEIIVAVFSGLLIHWLTIEMGVSENLRTVSVALAGYCARSVTAILNKMFIAFVKRNFVD